MSDHDTLKDFKSYAKAEAFCKKHSIPVEGIEKETVSTTGKELFFVRFPHEPRLTIEGYKALELSASLIQKRT